MSFIAKTFIYNGIPCEMYGLQLGDTGDSTPGGGEATVSAGSDVALLTQKIYRRPTPLLLGVEQTPVLSFPLSMYSTDDNLDAQTYSSVAAWLFGQQSYEELTLCQSDMTDVKFQAFFTAPQITRIGNFIRNITATVICDSPWGFKPSKTLTHTYSGYISTDTIAFLNESANVYYTFPTSLIITGNVFGGSVSITNISDSSRVLSYALDPSEVVTLDCENQIITSTTKQYPLYSLTDFHWLRFVQGLNQLQISGNISSISISYTPCVKIGG